MSEFRPQKVVIVHQSSVDPSMLVQQAGIQLPVEIRSFTDTHPRHNEYNSGLAGLMMSTDHLLIEDKSFDDMSHDSESAQNTLRLSSRPHTVRVFSDGIVTRILTAAGYDYKMLIEDTERRAEEALA